MDAFTDTNRDLSDKRPMGILDNDFVIKHKDEDPHGFWWVCREKGQVPAELSGAYTTLEYAQTAVKAYVSKVS